jgi:hypothetical protein
MLAEPAEKSIENPLVEFEKLFTTNMNFSPTLTGIDSLKDESATVHRSSKPPHASISIATINKSEIETYWRVDP